MYQQVVRPQKKVSAHKFLGPTKSNNEITTGKAQVEIVISCLIWWDETSNSPRCHSTGNSQFLFTVTWRPLKRLQIGGMVWTSNHKVWITEGVSRLLFLWFLALISSSAITVQLHFPRFARTRHGVLCNGSLRDPNVQTGIPEDRSALE